MFKNGMRPVHPGESLLEDYIRPLGLSVRGMALALHVPHPASAPLLPASAA